MAKESSKPVKKEAKAVKVSKPASAPKEAKRERGPRAITRPFRAIGGYFKGAWVELRQVRWPNRGATWSLTLAVILFSVFFAGLILGLDTLFHFIFRRILQ